MDLNVIEKVLYACSDVHNVKVVDMTIFREEEYQKIIECDLSVAKQVVPIVVAVPQNWQRTLIDIYIAQNMTFPFIPHVDIKGKFCLFETEGKMWNAVLDIMKEKAAACSQLRKQKKLLKMD